MNLRTRLLRHLRAILPLPVFVLGIVPLVLVRAVDVGAFAGPGSLAGVVAIAAGVLALLAGLSLLAWTIALFDRVGAGTLAPWDPPVRLVVRGPYRHVRNPMITGVLLVLLGESLVLRFTPILGWCLTFLAINAVYLPLHEERGLARRFGADYAEYRSRVRRWLPSRHAWQPERAAAASAQNAGAAAGARRLPR